MGTGIPSRQWADRHSTLQCHTRAGACSLEADVKRVPTKFQKSRYATHQALQKVHEAPCGQSVQHAATQLQHAATCCNMQWSAQAEKLASETPNVMATDIDAQIMGEDSEMQACCASTACCMLYIECCMLLPGELRLLVHVSVCMRACLHCAGDVHVPRRGRRGQMWRPHLHRGLGSPPCHISAQPHPNANRIGVA